MRFDNRNNDQIREIKITPNFQQNPAGSVMIEAGNTRIICSATIVDEVPPWMRAQKVKGGWITAEYQLLPTSTNTRVKRERKGTSGRTQEIQRLIGRSLRAACNLEKLENKTIYIDCDVIDADGGTRCAGITGSMIALRIAIAKFLKEKKLTEDPIKYNIAAISVGIIDETELLDLCYEEDSNAEVDMNVIMTENFEIVEIQGTAEGKTFTRNQMNNMLDLAEKGLSELFKIQNNISKKF
ncbi:MAG TPA: ribonuclease PH [Victivallales bacterium]|nr:ribonuclease PH [Victivallales bacterium]